MIEIKIHQFEGTFKIYFDGEVKQFNKAIGKENYTDEYLNELCGMCCPRGSTMFIWLKRKGIDVAGHEFLHGIKALCKLCGVDDEETECFLLDYLLREYIKKSTLEWIIPEKLTKKRKKEIRDGK